MSESHQTDERIDRSPAWIVGLSEQWASTAVLDTHSHARHQIIFARKGVIHVTTAQGSWILPPTRALWIRSGTAHAFQAARPIEVVILYVAPQAPGIPDWEGCAVLNVSPLVRELICACAAQSWDAQPDSAAGRLAQVLLDRLATLPQAPLALPEPIDPRALRVAAMVRQDLADRRTVAELASAAGASARTVERLFATETGMSFGSWRIRHRMLAALERLAYGDSVGDVAFSVGYESASSFVAAFRQAFGTTPARYFDFPQA